MWASLENRFVVNFNLSNTSVSSFADNPARANAFFVPFFSYLHLINHETGASKRDESYNYLIAELEQLPYLERHGGIDHFMVIGGRTALFKSDRIDESRVSI